MRRIIVLNVVLLLLVIVVGACKSSVEKRVNKGIIGINKQLYDLKKNQTRDLFKTVSLKIKELKNKNRRTQ